MTVWVEIKEFLKKNKLKITEIIKIMDCGEVRSSLSGELGESGCPADGSARV